MSHKIGAIILAAGSSSRLGYPKQLVKFRGNSLLQHSIDVAESLELRSKILVLGAQAEIIIKEIDTKNFHIAFNENWKEGMGTSISTGISEALKFESDLEHVLILLSDQPFVTEEKIQELISVHLSLHKSATFSEYAGEVGVPAIFSKAVFPNLKMLKGDNGAKKLLYEKDFEFGTVNFEKGNFDVDTTQDVEQLKRMEQE